MAGEEVDFSSAKVGLKLKEMTSYLGIAEDEPHLFWIGELALLAKLPPHWRQYKDEEGHAYFHNHATNVTSWQHPRDGYFFELVARERKKIKAMKQLADAQRRMKWDPDGRLEGIVLSNGNSTALHASEGMYPSLRTGVKMMVGTYCFQMRIDTLQEDGFMMIGMGKENFHYNADAIPPDDYNCHGYTTVGEIYVCGKLIQSSLEKLHEGDLVTMVVHFDDRSIVWYRNRHPIGFYEGFEGTSLYPCLVFGFKGYQASIVRATQLPHALMKWMADDAADAGGEKRVIITNRGFTARSNSETGYTTVRTSGYFDIDNPYFEVEVEMLARDGFLMFGLANQYVHESPSQIPVESYNHFGYASSGEAFALGVRVKSGLPRIQRGDLVGMRLLLDVQRLVFYVNNKPIIELVDLPAYEHYYPCCTLGNAGYQVRILPCPRIPLGLPRWLPDSMQPPRFALAQDSMLASTRRAAQCVTIISSVEYDGGQKEYFEVSLQAIHPEAELCVGVATAAVVDNFRAIPAPEYRHFGYCNNGDLVALGQVVQTGCPRIRVPDRIGVLVDLDRNALLFFHNGHPVGLIKDNQVRARLTPCLTCVKQFEALLDPTPAVPAFPPEWDPERAQDNIEVSQDRRTALVPCDTESARTIWSTSVYTRGQLYLEMQVELHGRTGWMVYGVGNRNMASGKFATRAQLPYEEYYVIGYTSRGDIINAGGVERRGEEQWCNGDRMGLYIDFVAETYAAYKNGHCVVVGNCPGVGVGVSPMTTLVYGPHSMRLIPLPQVPNPPQRWDAVKCSSEVALSQYDLLATNKAASGYPTIVATQVLRHGVHYVEFTIEYLPRSSFMLIGVTGGPAHQANERVPSGEFHCWGYASAGEIWAHGARVQGGREDLVTGDSFGMLIDLDAGSLTFFRNGYPVGLYIGMEGPGVADGVRPCCTFGYTNYAIRINPCARIPEGTPRFDMVCKSPDIKVSHDHLTATCTSYLQSHTARGTSGAM